MTPTLTSKPDHLKQLYQGAERIKEIHRFRRQVESTVTNHDDEYEEILLQIEDIDELYHEATVASIEALSLIHNESTSAKELADGNEQCRLSWNRLRSADKVFSDSVRLTIAKTLRSAGPPPPAPKFTVFVGGEPFDLKKRGSTKDLPSEEAASNLYSLLCYGIRELKEGSDILRSYNDHTTRLLSQRMTRTIELTEKRRDVVIEFLVDLSDPRVSPTEVRDRLVSSSIPLERDGVSEEQIIQLSRDFEAWHDRMMGN